MLVWFAFVLMALVWAAWLFGQVFTGKHRIIAYLSLLVLALGSRRLLNAGREQGGR